MLISSSLLFKIKYLEDVYKTQYYILIFSPQNQIGVSSKQATAYIDHQGTKQEISTATACIDPPGTEEIPCSYQVNLAFSLLNV